MKSILLAMVASVALTQPSYASDGLKQVAKLGDWRIMRETDAMTDAPSCIAVWGATDDVQMSSGSLFIHGGGSAVGYWLRLDNQAPSREAPMQMFNDVLIEGAQFAPVKNARRVRVRLDVAGGSVDYDLDMADAPKVFQVLDGPQCN